MPTSEGQDPKTITLAGGWALSIPENADAKDETFEFIKHLMDPEVYTDAVIAQGNIATRQDVAGDRPIPHSPSNRLLQSFWRALISGRRMTNTPLSPPASRPWWNLWYPVPLRKMP